MRPLSESLSRFLVLVFVMVACSASALAQDAARMPATTTATPSAPAAPNAQTDVHQVELPFKWVQPKDSVLLMRQYLPMVTADFYKAKNAGQLVNYFYHVPGNTTPLLLLTMYKDYFLSLGFTQDKTLEPINWVNLWHDYNFMLMFGQKKHEWPHNRSRDKMIAVFKKEGPNGVTYVALWAGQSTDADVFTPDKVAKDYAVVGSRTFNTGDNFLLVNISWPGKAENALVDAAPLAVAPAPAPVTTAPAPPPAPVTPKPETAAAITQQLKETGRVDVYGLLFDFNKADLKPESKATLDAIATALRGNPTMEVFIIGHTDNVGKADYNQKLSEARAKATVEALAKNYGISASRMVAGGKGMTSPVASNDTEEGSA
jgi:outer membrane protein OmpA-like peptidoglycan-associated protein